MAVVVVVRVVSGSVSLFAIKSTPTQERTNCTHPRQEASIGQIN